MKHIEKENLRPIIYGFVSDDYVSDFNLLRGHHLEDDLDFEDDCDEVGFLIKKNENRKSS